jgi:hypothetical protein
MPARRTTRTTQRSNPTTRGRGGRTTRPRAPTRFADGEIFPQPEPDSPRIHTLPNTPEPEPEPESGLGDDDVPVTPAPTRKANTNHQGGDGPGPAAHVTTADLEQLEQRLLARLQQAGTPPTNFGVPSGSQLGSSTPFPLPPPADISQAPAPINPSEGDSLPQPLRNLFMATGVDSKTILEIAHNKFKAINLYRLLGAEREQSDSRGVASLNLDSMRVEQQRQWKESDYKNEASFWRAWELYKAAFLATAPISLQPELAVSLSIYTANLWGLRSDYTWAGMKAYHFSFHHDLLESDAGRYNPITWRTLDSARMAAKCFRAVIPEEFRSQGGRQPRLLPAGASTSFQQRLYFPNTCRNFNNGRCTVSNCRWSHQCESCGGDHGAFQCQQRDVGNSNRPGGGWQRPSNPNRGRVGAA